MKICFLAETPCLLKVSGTTFGVVGTFEKSADISLKDNLLLEFLPENALPIRFFLTERTPFSPPENVDIYRKKDGIILFVHGFCPTDFSMKVLSQKRFGDTLVTLFCQGEITLIFDSPTGCKFYPVPHKYATANIRFLGGVALLFTETDALCVSEKDGILFDLPTKKVEFSSTGFTVYQQLFTTYHAEKKLEYTVTDGSIFLENSTLICPEKNRDILLAFAFFEGLMIGYGIEKYLSDDLKEKLPKIKAFVGNYTEVLPTEKDTKVGLVRKIKDRVFRIDEFSVTVEDGKICDVNEE